MEEGHPAGPSPKQEGLCLPESQRRQLWVPCGSGDRWHLGKRTQVTAHMLGKCPARSGSPETHCQSEEPTHDLMRFPLLQPPKGCRKPDAAIEHPGSSSSPNQPPEHAENNTQEPGQLPSKQTPTFQPGTWAVSYPTTSEMRHKHLTHLLWLL